MDDDICSPEELKKITLKKQGAAQARFFMKLGIKPIFNSKGIIIYRSTFNCLDIPYER